MAGRNDRRIKKLKKSHTLIWLIVFILLIILSCVLVSFFASVYSTSFINGKLENERKTVQNMSNIYEICTREGNDPSSVLASFGKEYFIMDSEGNIKAPGSSFTCVIPGIQGTVSGRRHFSPISISAYIYHANVYPDLEAPVVEQEGEDIVVYIIDILKDIDPYIAPSDRKLFSNEELKNVGVSSGFRLFGNHQEQMVKIPLWIGVKMSDQDSEFVAKSYITAEIPDLILLLTLMISIWLLVLITYLVMVISIIGGIVRQRRTLRVFFTDAVTGGNNYMYFLYRGAELLKKRRNRSYPYYVVNLSFIGYRNFCVCHSAEEGEKVTGQIYRTIQTSMHRRKEILSHVAEGDYALLLRGSADPLKERVLDMIQRAAHVTEDHVFAIQAGISVLEPVIKAKERKKIDLGEIYNIACATRESLDSDDTGIAFFDEKLVEDRRWAETVQDHQREALGNEEFVVYYQPKYDPKTDELRGAEALIRWQSPEFGFVPPGRMIPIFEKNGFITEIDHYMITHVARDQKRWSDSGYRCVPVSVNVSRAHFIESDLAEQIRDAVDAEGTPHELVEIELTESAFFDDKKALVNTIKRLQSYGFTVSMDDFGSGYSSLNSLKDMPLDVLKLDAEFFRGENGEGRGEIVVSEAIKLAKNLNMRTVAEGVEYLEQVEFLATQGCDMIQGYFYAKPMPAADYEVRMNERFKPKEAQ